MRDWSREEFLTVSEVASVLRVTAQSVRNWMNDGKLPYVRVGDRRVRILRSDLEGMMRGYHDAPPAKGSDEIGAIDFWGGVTAGATPAPSCGEAGPAMAAIELRPDALDEVNAELFGREGAGATGPSRRSEAVLAEAAVDLGSDALDELIAELFV